MRRRIMERFVFISSTKPSRGPFITLEVGGSPMALALGFCREKTKASSCPSMKNTTLQRAISPGASSTFITRISSQYATVFLMQSRYGSSKTVAFFKGRNTSCSNRVLSMFPSIKAKRHFFPHTSRGRRKKSSLCEKEYVRSFAISSSFTKRVLSNARAYKRKTPLSLLKTSFLRIDNKFAYVRIDV